MISVIIPFYNERDNLEILYKELCNVFKSIQDSYELLFVDDGSLDGGRKIIDMIASNDRNCVVLHHPKRKGKGEALATGVSKAQGDVIIFMDSDLQNDPADIPRFLHRIEKGSDFVNGIRERRENAFLITVYSFFGNKFLRHILRSPYTDINCGFKAMRRNVLDSFVLYANNFRFLPLAVYLQGYTIEEMAVTNRPRIHGVSKFGTNKAFGGFIDMITAYFLYEFSEKPLHFFGSVGAIIFSMGSIILLWLGYERVFFGHLLYRRPVLFIGFLFVIVGIQILMTGFIGELVVYLHKKSSVKK